MNQLLAHPENSQYLTFSLGGEMFALAIAQVKEIIEFGRPTAVPMLPPWVLGVINLRGAVVPVLDLSARFGRPPTVAGRRACIVIVEVEEEDGLEVMGILVDGVSEVLEIAADQMEAPPAFGLGLQACFIAAMARVAGRFVMVLNGRVVLAREQLAGPAGSGAVLPGLPPPLSLAAPVP